MERIPWANQLGRMAEDSTLDRGLAAVTLGVSRFDCMYSLGMLRSQ